MRLNKEQLTGSKLGKDHSRPYAVTLFMSLYAEYIMQNAGWMTHKLESILPGELPQTSEKQIIPPYLQRMKRN